MNSSPGPVAGEDGDRGLKHFHIALAGVFTLFLAPVVSIGLALRQPGGFWRRALFVLGAIDVVVCGCLIITFVSSHGAAAQTAAKQEHPRIGVTLSPTHPADGVKVGAVNPGSPAEQSGLRAGDVIERLDGTPTRDNDAFTAGIGSSQPGVARVLHLRRGGAELDIPVVPALGLKSGKPPPLFEPIPADDGESWSNVLQGAVGYLPILIALGIIALVARRRAASLLPLAGVAAAFSAYVLVAVAVVFLFQKTVGLSLGAILLSMVAAGLTMLVLGILQAREGVDIPPPLGAIPAFLRGLFYALAGAARAGIVIAALVPLLKIPDHSAAEVFGVSSGWSPGGIVLFVMAAVVLAPAGEEYLFRGVLLPWLTTWMKPLTAILVSTAAFGVGHLYYGAGVLIPTIYGLALGWVRLRTGRLRAGIALHMFFNASATLVLLLKG